MGGGKQTVRSSVVVRQEDDDVASMTSENDTIFRRKIRSQISK